MIRQKKTGELIIISGTTCAGKGTIINKLLENNKNLALSISYTSRAPREGEVDGVDYKFITREKFEEKIKKGEFLEYAKVRYGEYFGTPKEEVDKLLKHGKDVLLEIDVQGAKQIKEMYPYTVLIFVVAPTMEEVKRRIIKRGKETNEQIVERFKTAYKELNEIPNYNYIVVNDNIYEAVNKIEAILTSIKCRVDRIEELSMENEEEIIHELLADNKTYKNEPIDIK
ncbi:MAG: guanylate kinase [Bacilli bacterium]|nr:guanylate kinase [Bacilli bacterium]